LADSVSVTLLDNSAFLQLAELAPPVWNLSPQLRRPVIDFNGPYSVLAARFGDSILDRIINSQDPSS
jgi:hypothetical protein